MWFVYILKCTDGSLYTGSTNDLDKRLAAHKNMNGARYTKSHLAVGYVYTESKRTHGNALRREAEIKRLTRVQKLKLIEMSG